MTNNIGKVERYTKVIKATGHLYRVENQLEKHGIWRNFDGSTNPVFDQLSDGKCKTLPMDDSSLYRSGGWAWFSATDDVEKLQEWFSLSDVLELFGIGYRIYEFTVREYKWLNEYESVFRRSDIISQREVLITDVFPDKDYYSQEELICLGLSKALINDMLPEPKRRQDPQNKKRSLRLYQKDIVSAALRSVEWINEKENISSYTAKDEKVSTKEYIDKFIRAINVKVINVEELINLAIAEKKKYYEQIGEPELTYITRGNTDEGTIARWSVNYIRHELTNYNKDLYDLSEKVETQEVYGKYKVAVLEEIAKAYPQFKPECERQMAFFNVTNYFRFKKV